MGEHSKDFFLGSEGRAGFIGQLLKDIKALEIILEKDIIESGISRIGAEQEFCLVEDNSRPSKLSPIILEEINDSHFTTELALYNLEINLDPIKLKANCFSEMENQLQQLLSKAQEVAKKRNTKIVLTGILPSICKRELELDYLTPMPRYFALNKMIKELRGTDFTLHLMGVDELDIQHNSVLFEACNTSFQTHLQLDPDDFVSSFNWAQAISAPVLGLCANSPLLLGRELWHETRIALFQQSIDTRMVSQSLKDQLPRVAFGNHWAQDSIAEIFKNNISRHKVILGKEIKADALEDLEQGKVPGLDALKLFNSTVYQWNRPCYGTSKGKAHVRIENRYLPAGPTQIDQIANFAFWVGLMKGRPAKYDELSKIMDAKEAKANFMKAARTGKETVLNWMGQDYTLKDLVLEELIPIARSGLEKMNVDQADIKRFLDIIESRARGRNGAQWTIANYRLLLKSMKRDDALLALTRAIYLKQQQNIPVHLWEDIKNPPALLKSSSLVSHIMTTQLYKVDENDLAQLATKIMSWKNIHHMPVEDKHGKFCGLLTWSQIEQFDKDVEDHATQLVADIMIKDVTTVRPWEPIEAAVKLMKEQEIGCLPVVREKELLGIITKKDLTDFGI
ncbi:MAG TPA: CBS domain-containing protein [Salegentibacter sp.]|nr:CBS domain-containing protein [Salegentibacter sp.]